MPTFNGTNGNDTLNGTVDPDIINGLGGNDLIDAGLGNDTIDAGEGDDTIWGSDGSDRITDGAGSDTVYGDAGSDYIYASVGAGSDYYDGGWQSAIDTISYTTARAGVIVDLAIGEGRSIGAGDAAGIGIDQLVEFESVYGSDFGDIITGANGPITNLYLYGRGGNDQLTGGDASDNISTAMARQTS